MTMASMAAHSTLAVRLWLTAVTLMVFAMVVVGGATRLTDSGLSITEWKPLLGAIPPLSDADWADAFEKYKRIPEYQRVNKGMSLAAFKTIFWWEWAHRFLGRLIGLVFALPLAFFWLRGSIPHRLRARLVGIFALGAVQGGIGWYMVMSGLVDRVDVSHYRLALHLTVAFVIFALLIWTLLDLQENMYTEPKAETERGMVGWIAVTLVALIFLQVILGAFVAGLKAGLSYTTWPLMDGALIPPGLFDLSPWYVNFFENHLTVQFQHRVLAYAILAVALYHAFALLARGADARLTSTAFMVLIGLVAQAGLGIWTLLAVDGAIPIGLGILHQAGAALVLGLAVLHLHCALHHSGAIKTVQA